MIPARALLNAIANLLAADTGILANAAALHVHLAASAFTPSPDLDPTTITEASFTGSAPLAVTIGTQDVYVDSADGLLTIQLGEPVGGWTWLCTADPLLPETITGIFVTDNTDTDLVGSFLLDAPQTIDAAGQGLTIGHITLKFDENSPF